jgi:hypothetical protein
VWRSFNPAARLAAAAALALGCGGAPDRAAAPGPAGAPRAFRFESLDEREVSSDALKGRASVVSFVATYGDASMLQLRYLEKVQREHAPRVNAAVVFLEPADNRPLVRLYCESLGLRAPAAMADADTIRGKGPFPGIDTVPSVVVVDRRGREVWRKVGVAQPDELSAALRRAQAADEVANLASHAGACASTPERPTSAPVGAPGRPDEEGALRPRRRATRR